MQVSSKNHMTNELSVIFESFIAEFRQFENELYWNQKGQYEFGFEPIIGD